MDSIPTLRTARLILEPLQERHIRAIQRLFPHWEVVRYLDSNVPWPYPDDGAACYVREVALPAMREGSEWHWMISLLEAPEHCIGSICLYDQPDNHRGFWLAPAWHGQGYMSEACTVINRYWFQTLGREVMRVPKAVGNHASRRISEREGMRLVGIRSGRFVSGALPKELWELHRDEWLRRQ